MEILQGSDGNQYKIKNKRIYILNVNKVVLVIEMILTVFLVLLVLYDAIKDYIREWSAFFDLLDGNFSSSAVKYMGFTTGNFIRGIGIFILIVLILLFSLILYTETEVDLSSVPDNVSKRYKEIVKP